MVTGEQSGTDQKTKEVRDEYLEVCPRCGQSFDSRILHQVIYHDQPEHKPIETNA